LVKHGEAGLTVYGEVHDGERIRRLGVTFTEACLDRRVDGQDAKGSDLAAIVPIQAIGPDSHALIEGGPSGRRRFLDWGVFHVEHSYLEIWQRYRRLLGQRNTALKTAAPSADLDVWTKPLADAGEAIDRLRAAYVARLVGSVREHSHALLGAHVELEYRRGWTPGVRLSDALAASVARDRHVGHTESGPHRADLSLCLDGRKVENVASRGQQKLVAAALILGQETILAATHGAKGVLLVDDPAAELDSGAFDRLLDRLALVGSQLVLTGIAPLERPSQLAWARFHVEHGRVHAL
jgi:DNA replication and repair protein RecF